VSTYTLVASTPDCAGLAAAVKSEATYDRAASSLIYLFLPEVWLYSVWLTVVAPESIGPAQLLSNAAASNTTTTIVIIFILLP